MRLLALLGLLSTSFAGDRIGEINWLSSKDAFEKAGSAKPARWVLIYKEWPS